MFELPPPEDNDLFVPKPVGPWSRDKHHFLGRYLDAFTTAMKGKAWGSLHYIDLFAGAGVERIRESEELTWGSPLIAAQVPFPFERLHCCEESRKKHEALVARLKQFPLPNPPQVICGDANRHVGRILDEIPEDSLSVAFLDPFGLHCDFTTVKALSRKRIDLTILMRCET